MYHYTQYPLKYKDNILCKGCFRRETDDNEISTDFFAPIKEVKETWFCDQCGRAFIIEDYDYFLSLEK